jgi:hypothetical protein
MYTSQHRYNTFSPTIAAGEMSNILLITLNFELAVTNDFLK